VTRLVPRIRHTLSILAALSLVVSVPGVARAQSAGFDPGANAIVYALAVQPDGKVLIGGNFTAVGGGGSGTPRHKLARLDADGSVDTTFDPGANGLVFALAVQPDGKILVGGIFTTLGGGGTGTTTRNSIGRLNADGSLDESFDPGANGAVWAFAPQPDGKIVVGGNFSTLGGGGTGTTARNSIGRLNADGSLDTTFNPGANSIVLALALQSDGKILAGGGFSTLGGGGTGTTTRNYIGRLETDGSLDTSFDPGADTFVRALAVQPDGKIVVGGDFTALGGGGFGTTVRTYIGRLDPDGSLDTSFDPSANGNLNALAVQPDGRILVGGNFTLLAGSTRDRLGRLDADGSLDISFNAGADNAVTRLALQPDGGILVGGSFTVLAGTTRNRIGRLHADGSLDAPWVAPTATAGTITVTEDTPSSGTLSASDPDSAALTFSIVDNGSKGTAVVTNAATGAFSYTPNANATGSDSFTFKAHDGDADSNVATISVSITPVDDAPTISALTNQTIDEDQPTGALDFTVNDIDTSTATWSVSAASSDLTLVPSEGMAFGGADNSSNRTITVTPAANQSGTATISVTFSSEAGSTATRSFTVTVNSVNDAPTIGAIANQTLDEDHATGALAFTVGDIEGATLTVTATPSDPVLVPNGGIALTGSGANRSAVVTPAPDRNGTATITLTVTDGALTASTTFTVTVTAVNDAPTITAIANRTIDEDTTTGALAFTVNDVDGGTLSVTASSSNATLVPNGNVAVGGSGANRSVSVRPADNRFGTTTITVTVGDGALTSSAAFDVNVTAVNDPPTLTELANATTPRNAPVTATFTVDDIEGGPGVITLTGVSSNRVLVHSADLVFGGTAENRTLTIAPAQGLAGVTRITVTASDGSLTASRSFVLTVGTYAPFADGVLTGGSTPIRAVHVTELRSRIDTLRTTRGLAVFNWTDPALAAGTTPMKVVHIVELRRAVTEAYLASGRSAPSYTDPEIIPGVTTIKTAHLEELRSAVIALE
jgi:uncharacterized delta-60 repeat protein